MTENISPAAATDHSPITTGSPVWVDLGVPDLGAVQGFYQSLFGWEFEDMGPDFANYHLITRHGASVGGAMSQMESDADQPAAWTVYLKSDDIEKSLTDTAAAGGSVIVPAMPMPGLGSMGVVITPGGEGMGIWQADGFEGFVLNGAVGAPVWFEVMSFDYDADAEYYQSVWGWELTRLGEKGEEVGADAGAAPSEQAGVAEEGGEGGRYANNHPGKAATAGLCDAPREWFPEGTDSYWRPYFIVENIDAAAELVRAQGGSVVDGPMDTPFGRLATVADPAGATFQISELPAR
ncbi:VOC family protein [Cellulosimicrobium funkei]|nr:VOC family protein [Cellulosimicrobium funkei]